MLVRFSFFLTIVLRPELLMDYEEGVEGSNSPLPVHEAQPVVSHSQAEALNEPSSSTCYCIPSRAFRPFTSICGGNIDHSQRNINDTTSDQPTQAGQRQSQAEAQIGAYFLTIAETWPDGYKINFG